MKKIAISFSIFLFLILAACSDDEVTPQERFDTYVKQWNQQKFNEMYDTLSQKSTDTYPTKDFVDRYKKIYDDLGVSDLKVTYEKLDEESLKNAMDEGKATFPFSVKMQTIAGPISFDYDATLILEGEEDKQNWYVQWDPGFIFPAIKDGGEIRFQTESPERGEIYDRNQQALAKNDTVYEIGIVPEKLGDNPEKMKEKISDLTGVSIDDINSRLNADWVKPNLFVPIAKMPKTKEKILNKLWELGSVSGREVIGRVYPYGKATAHLVGYVGKITAEQLEKQEPGTYSANDIIGYRGLEQLYEEQLKGQKGIKIVVSKEGEEDIVLAETPVKDGEDIVTTINAELQKKIFNSYGEDAGTTAAINPETGETLALVSSPAFDPNEILYGAPNWEAMENDPQHPTINRFAATFVPGSAIKPVTASIGLQNGSIVPGEGVKISGLTWSNGEGWGNYKVRRVSESSGPVDIMDALIRSDNIYFAMKGIEMGSEALVSGFQQFGFGGDGIPFEYPIEKSTVANDGTINDEVLLADTSYGQGQMQMSALHLAMAYTPFLNDGNMLKPTLLEKEETGQIWKENLVTTEQIALIQDALRQVVTSPKGTAHSAEEAGIPLSGKTGTAELKKAGEDSGQENGWFVAYPTEEPNILIAMMIEHTEDKGGSHYTVEKVTDIFKEIR
ncbi:penicillin-binding transpeptidase domain-containing protein [Virgibacillus oceani]|uniref:serine-type D-Ala-D-Ala carboxypeptidase n=1 Tax=Virgibacillus oceani TaxID=1479511 RepID=A0A917H4M4_9BACI|nr:penicillin-binding transpeptidase domain-containing protein [Virgibacillus oceani]GGG67495.1 penicillin-binding protein 3 [Virgibacillus oceani]